MHLYAVDIHLVFESLLRRVNSNKRMSSALVLDDYACHGLIVRYVAQAVG